MTAQEAGAPRSPLEWKPSRVLEGIDVREEKERGRGMHINFGPENSCIFCITKIYYIIMNKGYLLSIGRMCSLSSGVSQVDIYIARHICSGRYPKRNTLLMEDSFLLKYG